MRIRLAFGIALLGASSLATSVSAQFHRPGSAGGGGSSGVPQLETALTQGLAVLVPALQHSMAAQAFLAEANGRKDLAAQLRETGVALSTGSPKDQTTLIHQSLTLSASAQATADSMFSNSQAVSDSSKKLLGEGLKEYAAAIAYTAPASASVSDVANAASGVDPSKLGIREASHGTELISEARAFATVTPLVVSNLGTGFRKAIAFARSRNIPVPPDVASASEQIPNN